MMRVKDSRWLVAIGIAAALLLSEAALRVLEPSLPDPSPWPSVEAHLKSSQLEDLGQSVDIVLLGSSITEAAVDPAALASLTEATVYNSALPFSSPVADEVWLEEVVLETTSPQIVLIGLPAWPHHATIETDPLRAGILTASAGPLFAGLSDHVALLKRRGVLADWDGLRARQRLLASGLWTDLGHQTGYYEKAAESMAGLLPPYGAPEVSEGSADAISAMVDVLREHGVRPVLVIEPGNYPGPVSEATVSAYLTSVRELGRQLEVDVWDTRAEDWDAGLFADEAHFNRQGTAQYTAYLAGLINNLTVQVDS